MSGRARSARGRAGAGGKARAGKPVQPVRPLLGRVSHWPWLPILIAVVAVSLWAGFGTRAADETDLDEPFAAVGYTEIVEQIFAPFGWLVRNEPSAGDSGTRPIVTLAAHARALPEVSRFMQGSFLRDDIEADDASRWRFDGDRVVGINPWVHSISGPRAERSRWRGSLFYRDSGRAEMTIEGGRRPLVLAPSTELRPIDREVSLEGEELSAGTSAHGLRFTDGAVVAIVQRIGTNVVVRALKGHPRVRASVIEPGGDSRGFAGGEAITYLLSAGSRLVFYRHGEDQPSGSAFRISGGSTPVSRYRPFGARIFDPSAETIARPLSGILDAAARHSRDLVDMPVRLTIDPSMQAEAQDALDTQGVALLTGRRHPFRAAIAVMDATTGELLAVASFPNRGSDARTPIRAPEGWLAQNQNFVALPIGSVAKVPFAAAITTWRPGLLSLVADGSPADASGRPSFRSVLGVDFGVPIQDTIGSPGIDFRTFIELSSNRYAATLLMLGAARNDPLAGDGYLVPRADQVTLAGQRQERAPLLAFPCLERSGQQCRRFGGVDEFTNFVAPGRGPDGRPIMPWPSLLERLLDLPGAQSSEVASYNTGIWAPLISDWSDETRRLFVTLSPETEMFRLNRIDHIRNDYLSLVIGGARSRWTTVKVAEAFSRIVLDHRVSARIIVGEEAEPMPRRSGFGSLALTELRAGMRAAAASGTAAALRPGFGPAAPPQEIRIFAKTGTPSLSTLDRSPLNAELDAMITLELIGMRDGQLAVQRRRPGESVLAALIRLRQQAERPDTSRRAAQALLGRIERINIDRRNNRADMLQFDDGGRLAGVAPDRADSLADRGGALAFVIGIYDVGADDGRPSRALTIVINVQARGRAGAILGPNPALQVGRDLLAANGAVGRWLLGGRVSARTPGRTGPSQ